jgi:hypothetical protein
LYFFSHDSGEPPHVHVARDRQRAKFWLAPVEAARNIGYSDVELGRVQRLVEEQQEKLKEAWDAFFGT